jgi:hypothetical protein
LALFAAAACGGVAEAPATGEGGSAEHDPAGPRIDDAAADTSAPPSDADASPISEAGAPDSALGPSPGDGAAWSATRHACGLSATGFVQEPTPPAGPSLTSCPGSGQVVLSSPATLGQDGGPIAPGATATVTMLVANDGAQGLSYPCVGVAADTSGVSFGPGSPEIYSIDAGVSRTFGMDVTFATSISQGSRVRFAAWLVWSGGGLADGSTLPCTSASVLEWDVVVN